MTPQHFKQYHRRTYASMYICMHIHIYMHTHIRTTCSECVRRCVCWCKNNSCVTYTPAHALVPKTSVTKCTQHSLKKNAHIYILTHICIRIHMHTDTRVHAWHHPHAKALILRPTIYAQICTHIHIHMYINAYIYIYIHTCIYIHIYMFAHIHTYTFIHTHTKCTYTRTQARLERRHGGICARSWSRRRKLCTSLSFDVINHI